MSRGYEDLTYEVHSIPNMFIAKEKTTHNIQASERVSYCKEILHHNSQHTVSQSNTNNKHSLIDFQFLLDPKTWLSGYVNWGTTTKQWNYVLTMRRHREAFAKLHPYKKHHDVAFVELCFGL